MRQAQMRQAQGNQDVQGILFDLDGTLLDTKELILASMRYATGTS